MEVIAEGERVRGRNREGGVVWERKHGNVSSPKGIYEYQFARSLRFHR